MRTVVDASVALKWYFPEPGCVEAGRMLAEATDGIRELLAPDLIVAEFANVLWKKVEREECSGGQAEDILEAFLIDAPRLVESVPLAPRALELALRLGEVVYDCLYLAARSKAKLPSSPRMPALPAARETSSRRWSCCRQLRAERRSRGRERQADLLAERGQVEEVALARQPAARAPRTPRRRGAGAPAGGRVPEERAAEGLARACPSRRRPRPRRRCPRPATRVVGEGLEEQPELQLRLLAVLRGEAERHASRARSPRCTARARRRCPARSWRRRSSARACAAARPRRRARRGDRAAAAAGLPAGRSRAPCSRRKASTRSPVPGGSVSSIATMRPPAKRARCSPSMRELGQARAAEAQRVAHPHAVRPRARARPAPPGCARRSGDRARARCRAGPRAARRAPRWSCRRASPRRARRGRRPRRGSAARTPSRRSRRRPRSRRPKRRKCSRSVVVMAAELRAAERSQRRSTFGRFSGTNSAVLWLRLDGDGPLHRQAYRALRAAILERRLRAGRRLPATRALARELGLSRNTVLAGLRAARGRGLRQRARRLGHRRRRGAAGARRAASARARRAPRRASAPRLSAFGARIAAGIPRGQASWSLPREPLPYDFRYGEPAYADLPLATWSRLLGRRARRLSVRRLAYQPPGGAPELREALAGYLARARGVRATPEQVIVVQRLAAGDRPQPRACSSIRATRWCSRSRTTPASRSA